MSLIRINSLVGCGDWRGDGVEWRLEKRGKKKVEASGKIRGKVGTRLGNTAAQLDLPRADWIYF